jgi:anti-anti-sigma regulatory factor/anti-sigma regulatory factor (Ser/Thr protein kinase)
MSTPWRSRSPSPEGELTCIAENDFPTTVVHAAGPLTYGTVPVLRRTVLKALTDHPELLLVDVSGVEAIDDLTLTALPMLAEQGALNEVAVMVCGPSPALARQLDAMAIGHRVPTFRSQDQAKAAFARQPAPRRARLLLEPVPSATAAARAVVDDVCTRWRISDIADTAALIATELVANAIQHARTEITFSVALRQTYLHIAVRDRSIAPPVRGGLDEEDDGRGLLIIESLAAGWGHARTADGKVVWATLRPRSAPVGRGRFAVSD